MTPQQVLNLNFHGIGRPLGRDFGPGEREFWASHETFEAVLDAIELRDDVRLSFDDGNSSDIDFALPALQARGLNATFFLVPGWLGEPGFMSKSDVRELVAAGMTVGNHGLQHQYWDKLDRQALEHEVSSGRRLLEELTGTTIETVAIPYGAYDDPVLQTLRNYNYTHVYTSDGGTADRDGWLQPREHVRAHHEPGDVSALLAELS